MHCQRQVILKSSPDISSGIDRVLRVLKPRPADKIACMPTLADFDLHSLEANFAAHGLRPIHALVVLRQFMETQSIDQLDPALIGRATIQHLRSKLDAGKTTILDRSVSTDGTTKLLIGFHGGGAVESVLMPGFRQGVAAGCVSSQIGCAMGCDFCASTRNGLERNLTAGEIVEQFLHLRIAAKAIHRRLKTLVFMGMGEPMLNLDHVMDAIRRIGEPRTGGIGWRQMTVSTVGIVPGIDRLADADLNVHLALSLHAPDDATRSKLVPSNRRYPVDEVMAAARRFEARTRRIPTIEYCMLAGINDSDDQAHLLADLMENFRAHVNLIPYNTIGAGVSGVSYARPSRERLITFLTILRNRKVTAHFRDTRGDDVNAACGQLRQTRLKVLAK
jgi:23S rRNA (adenine2503-C2)-methyltransferase